MTADERRVLLEVSVLDVPYAQRLLMAALDLLQEVEENISYPPVVLDAAKRMRAVLVRDRPSARGRGEH